MSEHGVELAFVDTDDLLDELHRRYPVMIFCGLRAAKDATLSERYFRWRGCHFGALGLLGYARHRIVRHIDETAEQHCDE